MCFNPRKCHTELRIILKDNLYFINAITVFDDDSGDMLLFPTPLTVPRASVEELKDYLKKLLESCEYQVIDFNKIKYSPISDPKHSQQ